MDPKYLNNEDWLPEDEETEGSIDENYDYFLHEMYEERY